MNAQDQLEYWWQHRSAAWERGVVSLVAGMIALFMVIVFIMLFLKFPAVIGGTILIVMAVTLIGAAGHSLLDNVLG